MFNKYKQNILKDFKFKLMTPKEKALELKEKCDGYTCYAEVTVDEMINMCKLYHNHNIIVDGKIYTELTIDYWEQVKQELKNI